MNLPNRLTILRILLVPVFAVLAHLANRQGHWAFYLGAAAIFGLASLTDMLDGQIARRNNLITDFGKFADPLADKILTTTAFLYMLQAEVCSPVVLALVLTREFAVSGLRMVASGSGEGHVIAANKWGKAKTVFQIITVLVFYVGCAIVPWRGFFFLLTRVLCWIVAALTLWSGAVYLWVNRRFIPVE